MKNKNFLIIFLLFLWTISWSQSTFVLSNIKQDKIRFKSVYNLIIIPVEVNGVELSFLLDTGISKSIIFNSAKLKQTLKIDKAKPAYLRGLGQGKPIKALQSKNNVFKIGKAINVNQDLYVVFDPNLNFSGRLGLPIHGIIGYDFFKDFVVEINYSNKFLKLHNQATYISKKCKKCKHYNLDFFGNKPYLNGEIEVNGNVVPVKLLIDTGGSDALWLFENKKENIVLPEKYFDDFLGYGINGDINGKRSKIDVFTLGDFKFNNINVAFPDISSIKDLKVYKDRNGSIAGEILKRFNIILDVHNKKISLKKNKNFSNSFAYNKSGLVIEQVGVGRAKEIDEYDSAVYGTSSSKTTSTITIDVTGVNKTLTGAKYVIAGLRENSPAKKAGLKIDDIIITINGKSVHFFSLQEIVNFFYDNNGEKIKLFVDRFGKGMNFSFILEDVLK